MYFYLINDNSRAREEKREKGPLVPRGRFVSLKQGAFLKAHPH